ncbi:hypothetical protein MBANPS3_000417 [Mucor bainieri]
MAARIAFAIFQSLILPMEGIQPPVEVLPNDVHVPPPFLGRLRRPFGYRHISGVAGLAPILHRYSIINIQFAIELVVALLGIANEDFQHLGQELDALVQQLQENPNIAQIDQVVRIWNNMVGIIDNHVQGQQRLLVDAAFNCVSLSIERWRLSVRQA